jgi:hypothetical protein
VLFRSDAHLRKARKKADGVLVYTLRAASIYAIC